MASAAGKVVLIGAGYWRPDGIGGSLRRRSVDVWLDWHDKRGIWDSTDWFEAREQAISEGVALLLHVPEDLSFFSDEEELTRLAAARTVPIFAFRTSAAASWPAFLGEVNAVLYDFLGPPKRDEELLDRLAANLRGTSVREGAR